MMVDNTWFSKVKRRLSSRIYESWKFADYTIIPGPCWCIYI